MNQSSVLVCPGEAVAQRGPTPDCDCKSCALVRVGAALLATEDKLARLLAVVGTPGACRGCNAPILWVTTKTGKAAPYTPAGVSHFSDCPAADRFRREKKS